MDLNWIPEVGAVWDEDKQRIIGGAPAGALDTQGTAGERMPGDWWAAVDDAQLVVGYGWLETTWGGDAEILLAVDPDRQSTGVGGFILENLEQEAAKRGLNYVYNTVRESHPDRNGVHDWLAIRGYKGGTSDTALRKRVTVAEQATVRDDKVETRVAPDRPDVAPGREDSGGYVNDVEDHQY